MYVFRSIIKAARCGLPQSERKPKHKTTRVFGFLFLMRDCAWENRNK